MVNEKPDKSRVFTVPMLGKCYTGTVLSYGGELIPQLFLFFFDNTCRDAIMVPLAPP